MKNDGQGFRPVDTDALGVHQVMADIDTSIAHPARVYDYVLGGKDNWPADRTVAEQVISLIPAIQDDALANRAFLRRAVRHAASQGVTQFLDIGTGIPTVGPTHEIAHSVNPGARVVYVDNDPIVLAHARALLVDDDLTYVIRADAREPETILDHPQTRRRLDFTQPVAVMFILLLHFITEEELAGLMERYARELAPGSHLLITHAQDTPEANATKQIYKTSSPLTPRSRARITELFAGWDLVDPGLVPVHDWRPDDEGGPESGQVLGGVAIKPQTRTTP